MTDASIALTIRNPGAEQGVDDWTSTIGTLATRAANPLPKSGSAYFYGGDDQSEAKAHQDVPLPSLARSAVDAGEAQITLSWWQNSFAGFDEAEMGYQFIDSHGDLIGSETLLGLATYAIWTEREFTFDVPEGARKVRLVMRMVRQDGNNCDGDIDDISAEIVFPESYLNEEVFAASFEDASGRDPLPTALIERTPARQLANHLLQVYLYPPYMATKRVPIELEDYEKAVPGNMMWHKDEDDPLFSMGRWGQIQGVRWTDNPLEVELTIRISDHPESFEEPT